MQTLQTAYETLQNSWKLSNTTKPFIETLLRLFDEEKLNEFDINFLNTWLLKKDKGMYARADQQARNLMILLSNKLGEKMYTTLAPVLGLPNSRQAQKVRAKETAKHHYLPGINDWAVELAASRELRPIQNSMDGTRVIRVIELYLDQYLVGKEFSPDVRCWPSADNLDVAVDWEQIKNYVIKVRHNKSYAPEAYSFNLADTSGKLPDLLIGSIPQAHSGISWSHVLAMMLTVDKHARKHNLPLVGHCIDSASNALGGLLKLASPSTYAEAGLETEFIGLRRNDFFAPILCPNYPTIAYPFWDHSSRTSVRNLMNGNISIVSEELDISNKSDNTNLYKVATIHDLRKLKHLHPGCSIKQADITPHVRQNCDATSRVLQLSVVKDLQQYIPDSQGTQLYLIASTVIHAPFRNDKFGPPPTVVQSLWKGVMIWRRWRKFIQVSDHLTLIDNFISSSHYQTLELLAHAGIIHQLTVFFAFPNLSIGEYSMRNTGNRGIKAIHGMYRGGTSLPITTNLSFK